jgi:hypothetical protein
VPFKSHDYLDDAQLHESLAEAMEHYSSQVLVFTMRSRSNLCYSHGYGGQYDLIIGMDVMQVIGLYLHNLSKTIVWNACQVS